MSAQHTLPHVVCGEGRDVYAEMQAAVRAWMERYHPDADGAAVYVWLDPDLPAVRVTIPAAASAAEE